MKIGCVILAGGKSSRMGEDKALLEFEGRKFIEKITDELSFFEEKLIARGNEKSLDKFTDSNWRIIPDIYPGHGPMGGVHAALKQCETDALFVTTCDMPFITKKIANKICAEMLTQKKDAIIAVTSDGKYHPLCGIYKKDLYKVMEEFLQLDHNRMMAVLEKRNVKYLQLNEEESKQLINVNTRAEYEKMF